MPKIMEVSLFVFILVMLVLVFFAPRASLFFATPHKRTRLLSLFFWGSLIFLYFLFIVTIGQREYDIAGGCATLTLVWIVYLTHKSKNFIKILPTISNDNTKLSKNIDNFVSNNMRNGMKTASIQIKSESSGNIYTLTVREKDGKTNIKCDCPAGQVAQNCKHKMALLKGDFSNALADCEEIKNLLDNEKIQNAVESYTTTLKTLERQEKEIKKRISELKKEFAEALVQGF